MPFDNFRAIKTEDDLMEFFRANFPDAIPLIGEESLRKQYFANPKGPLMSVKVRSCPQFAWLSFDRSSTCDTNDGTHARGAQCRPYHYTSAGLIIGDAAHSMVPFYGQGLNAGFEDVRLLNRLLDEHGVSSHVDRSGSAGAEDGRVLPEDPALAAALSAYTEHRHPDAEAIVDLAMENYVEMRSAVVSLNYLIRRRAERLLSKLFPSLVVPLYTMVSFTTIRYSEARQRNRAQGRWLLGSAVFTAAATLAGIAWTAARYRSVIERVLQRR
ncbi:MAG: hypothetical protein BJ554DRAFT_6788 [Olpidium bornovanus]|uniref:FAD-binding domain-containing protein n=1 Tax=Olpidium bornovanus TaxID=278681 RepID=A0A8H8DKG2_9FUNG|nr:MAG: hypothetical protein BJ554DRAFT_6788 [Olpidium bornovanus]